MGTATPCAVFAWGLSAWHTMGPKVRLGDVVVVHHVKVNPVGTSGNHIADFLSQFGKVSGQNRRGNTVG